MYDLRRFPHAQLPGVRGQHRKRMGQSGGSEEECLSVGSFRRSIRYVGQDGAEDTHAHTSVLRRQVMSSAGLWSTPKSILMYTLLRVVAKKGEWDTR
jgi:hypothetical protein